MPQVKISEMTAAGSVATTDELELNQAGTTRKGTALQVVSGGMSFTEPLWTPTILFGGAAVGMTFTLQSAIYTRMFNRVFFNGLIVLSAKGSSTGVASLGTLPIAVNVNNYAYAVVNLRLDAVTFTGQYSASLAPGATTALFYQTTEAGTMSQMTEANFTNTSSIIFSGFYYI